METLVIILLLLIIGLVSYLLFWPVKIQVSVVDVAPLPKAEGILAPNDLLSSAVPFGPQLPAGGPEDITLDKEGNLYAGLLNGQIIKMKADGSSYEVYAEVGGRPLGLAFDKKGDLYVANAKKGLQVVTKEKEIKSLVTETAGKPVIYASEVAVADDGMVYFTQGSTNYTQDDIVSAIIEPTGRLISYDSKTGVTRELVAGIHLANGVALSHNQEYVIFDESGTGRVFIHWVKGPKVGETSILVPNMPGLPDNISLSGADNLFWVALYNDGKLGNMTAKSPFITRILLRLPNLLFVSEATTIKNSRIAAIDGEGKIVKFLQDGKGLIPNVTSGIEKEGWLYLGSLFAKHIYRVKIN